MSRALGGIFAIVVISTTIFAINMFFTGVAGVLGLIPQLVPLAGRAVWGVLILSCRFYYLLLSRIAPAIERVARVDITEGLRRLAATVTLSFTFGCALLWLLQWDLNGPAIAALALHGLFVDLIWHEIPQAGDLQMGEKLKWDN
jgi:hypothetical protein